MAQVVVFTFVFQIFVAFLTISSAAHLKENAIKTNSSKRIVGGVNADIREAKFYAMLRCRGQFVCGGTLVSPNRVILAAHCLAGCPPPARFHVGMSSMADSTRGDSYSVVNMYAHPRYQPGNGNYDVAVAYLDGNVRTTDTVAPTTYALTRPPVGNQIVCYGYGDVSWQGAKATTLQKASFNTLFYQGNLIAVETGRKSLNRGDSGGPCVFENRLTAVVSYGTQQANFNVMTGASEIAGFLKQHIK